MEINSKKYFFKIKEVEAVIVLWVSLFSIFRRILEALCRYAIASASIVVFRPPLNSGGAQHCALLGYQSKEMKILNILFPQVGIEPTTSRVYSRAFVPLRHDWPHGHHGMGMLFIFIPTHNVTNSGRKLRTE